MNTSVASQISRYETVTCVAPGDITTTTEKAFAALVERAVGAAPRGWKRLDLDVRAARMIDSKGLNLLVSLVKSSRENERTVRLIAPQPSVRRILAFTRIDQHAEVVTDDGSAA